MKTSLNPHPNSTPGVASRIEVEARRGEGGVLELRYVVKGDVAGLLIPEPAAAPARTDGLWQHTCFEVFVGAADGYYEFNFSPSSAWAAYRFSGYREGMEPARIASPAIEWRTNPETAELHATLLLPTDAVGPIGLSAVIEEKDGGKSYWALAHPATKPDFHHPDGLVLQLPAP